MPGAADRMPPCLLRLLVGRRRSPLHDHFLFFGRLTTTGSVPLPVWMAHADETRNCTIENRADRESACTPWTVARPRIDCVTRCLHFAAGCTTGWVNYANERSQAALERCSQDAHEVIRLTRSKAAVWTVDDVARLIEN